MTTAYVTHLYYRLHTLDGHPEHAGRIEAIWALFEKRAILNDLLPVPPIPASVRDTETAGVVASECPTIAPLLSIVSFPAPPSILVAYAVVADPKSVV